MDTSPSKQLRVMVVDDSAVIRGMLSRALESRPEVTVTSMASNGQIALQQLKEKPVDIILLDVEMPDMDGITALPQLVKINPDVKVIMVSAFTEAGAAVTVKALAMGASDYIQKPSAQKDKINLEQFNAEIYRKIKALEGGILAKRNRASTQDNISTLGTAKIESGIQLRNTTLLTPPKAVAIGSSTGGPQALVQFFERIKGKWPAQIPIFITQHMPPFFTTCLAEHISRASGYICKEAKDGEIVESGRFYVAPGDFHMLAFKDGSVTKLRLNKEPPVNFCRPSVDPMLKSLVDVYGKSLLTIIFTGMGQDGLAGAQEVVNKGGMVVAQDKATSVVWGMPGAVATNGLCSAVLPLGDIAPRVAKLCGITL